jgi:hypothetical protein
LYTEKQQGFVRIVTLRVTQRATRNKSELKPTYKDLGRNDSNGHSSKLNDPVFCPGEMTASSHRFNREHVYDRTTLHFQTVHKNGEKPRLRTSIRKEKEKKEKERVIVVNRGMTISGNTAENCK